MRFARLVSSVRPAQFRSGLTSFLLLLAGFVLHQDAYASEQSTVGSTAGFVEIRFEDDLYTLSARNVRLWEVLAEIVRQTDLTVVSHAPLDDLLTLELVQLPLNDILIHVMRNRSYMLRNELGARIAGRKNSMTGGTLWIFSDRSSSDANLSLSTSAHVIEQLREQLKSDDVRVKQDAIAALRSIGTSDVVGPLSAALHDQNEKIRLRAIYALAEIGGDDAAAVLAIGLADENAWVRAETAYALGAVGRDSAIPILKLALDDADSRVRESAISAFTEIGGTPAADALALLLQDPDLDLRVEAVEALANISGETSIHLLRQATRDPVDAVREAATQALARLTKEDP